MPPDADRDSPWVRAAIYAALAYFAARAIVFAVAIDASIPPDETTHFGRVLAFAGTWGIPEPGPENHSLGLLGHRPFLYNWALGRLAAIGVDGLIALRLVNVVLSLGTLAYGLRFIRAISSDPLAHLLFVVGMTNTLMFTGVSASVSYDNGANLLAAAAFYYVTVFVRDRKPEALAALLLCAGLGCLTKRSFLPLAALLVGAILVHERGRLRGLRGAKAALLRPVSIAAAAVILANGLLYGGNLLQFGKLVPGFEQVVGVEAARSNRIFARDYILDGYREGRLAFREAWLAAGKIDHEGDRNSTRALLAGARSRQQRGAGERAAIPTYAFWWSRLMLDRATGYFGHRVIHRTGPELILFAALGVIALALHLWDLLASRRPPPPGLRLGAGVAFAYALTLMWMVNYPTYLDTGALDLGVQGRYLFPVWIPLVAFVAVALCEDAPRPLRVPAVAAASALFVFSDGPTFLLRTTPAWFGG